MSSREVCGGSGIIIIKKLRRTQNQADETQLYPSCGFVGMARVTREVEYSLQWRPVEMRSLRLPSIRSNAAATMIKSDLILFGGKGSSQFNEIWKFSSSNSLWEPIEAHGEDIPLPRDGHSLTKISETEFVIFGGQGHVMGSKVYEKQTENGKAKCLSIRKLFDDFYSFDCETLTWSPLPRRKVMPPGRRGHSLLHLSTNLLSRSSSVSEGETPLLASDGRGYLILFGGSCVDKKCSVEKTNNDMWLYSLATLEWQQVDCHGPPPLPLYGHCAEMVGHLMVVIGGNIAPSKGLKGQSTPLLSSAPPSPDLFPQRHQLSILKISLSQTTTPSPSLICKPSNGLISRPLLSSAVVALDSICSATLSFEALSRTKRSGSLEAEGRMK
jgi:hypothetical protein